MTTKVDSSGNIAPYKKGDRVYICPLKREATVIEQILHHDGQETFWGDLKLEYDDGTFGISNSWQCTQLNFPVRELYRIVLDRAFSLGGTADEGWNKRFIGSLDRFGLCLSSKLPTPSDKYPDKIPYTAPRPYLPRDAWPADTYICWKEDVNA